jgi:hypothetical protein
VVQVEVVDQDKLPVEVPQGKETTEVLHQDPQLLPQVVAEKML